MPTSKSPLLRCLTFSKVGFGCLVDYVSRREELLCYLLASMSLRACEVALRIFLVFFMDPMMVDD
jgi:hypothetical protein